MERKKTRQVKVGGVLLGGDAKVSIQSMTNTDTRDVEATLNQIRELHIAGCEIIRCAVPDMEAAEALKEICKYSPMPVVADIHFDYRLALKAIENGVSALRLNPGNIGSIDRVKIVAEAGFYDIVISIKSSDVPMMIKAYRLMSEKCDYPLHLGVTESGTVFRGTIKSTLGIGTLLAEGIGDTIRVSLTSDPIEEIKVAKEMLIALGLKKQGMQFVSCPTCGRTQINLIKIAEEVEKRLENCNKNIKVAVMGCVVNGPGEAREADIGIAGGNGVGLIFKKGQILRKVKEEDLVEELLKEIENL